MSRLVDLTGRVFERITVVRRAENRGRRTAWDVRCSCGKEWVVTGTDLKSGDTKSCGCLLKEKMSAVGRRTAAANSSKGGPKGGVARTKHGAAKRGSEDPTYMTWEAMRQRCTNPNSVAWPWYGAQGVSVCERWSRYENFLADMGPRPPGLTIDRINPLGNYEPGNCRWADRKTQANNTRRKHAQRR